MVSEQSQAGNDRLMQTRPSGGAGSGTNDLGTAARESAQDLQGTAQDVMQQTKETAGQVVDQAKEQAASLIDNRKEQVAGNVAAVAEALRQASKHLRQNEQAPIAQYADKAAERVEQLAYNLRSKDVQDMLRDVEDYARRQPALFLGGAFVVGLLAARFLKSSARRDEGQRTPPSYQAYQGDRGYGSSAYSGYRGSTYRALAAHTALDTELSAPVTTVAPMRRAGATPITVASLPSIGATTRRVRLAMVPTARITASIQAPIVAARARRRVRAPEAMARRASARGIPRVGKRNDARTEG